MFKIAPGDFVTLHAGVAAKASQRDKVRSRSDREGALGYKLERLCRYITRPAITEKRLSLTNHGKVRYELKTPYRDGTTHVIFEPVDFIAKLAALIPKPRVNLTRLDEGHPCPSPYRQPSVVQIHCG